MSLWGESPLFRNHRLVQGSSKAPGNNGVKHGEKHGDQIPHKEVVVRDLTPLVFMQTRAQLQCSERNEDLWKTIEKPGIQNSSLEYSSCRRLLVSGAVRWWPEEPFYSSEYAQRNKFANNKDHKGLYTFHFLAFSPSVSIKSRATVRISWYSSMSRFFRLFQIWDLFLPYFTATSSLLGIESMSRISG